MVKLVVSNPSSIQENVISSKINSNADFRSEVHMKTPSLYVLVAEEHCHYLNCEIPLELEEVELNSFTAICHFPDITEDDLANFVWEDDRLLSVILIQFQMKILKQLILFCIDHKVANLIIRADKSIAEKLKVYDEFVIYEDYVPGNEGMLTEMIIPISQNALDKWTMDMDEMSQGFRQILWAEYSSNPAMRAYLKSNLSTNIDH